MFGHKAAFVGGSMFTATFGKHVFVRLDEPSRVELLRVAGAKPFEPMKGRPMTEYVQLPEAFLSEPPKASNITVTLCRCRSSPRRPRKSQASEPLERFEHACRAEIDSHRGIARSSVGSVRQLRAG
jgi:TfoX/Sxy family transcriptional regulator of competence genes